MFGTNAAHIFGAVVAFSCLAPLVLMAAVMGAEIIKDCNDL